MPIEMLLHILKQKAGKYFIIAMVGLPGALRYRIERDRRGIRP